MLAFHNDPAIKEKYLSRVKAHRLADEIVKGIYWENGKGCAVGCTLHSSNHASYEIELGIPIILARLEDGIFEGLPLERAKLWPEEFLSAITVGADLSSVWPKFAVWLLTDKDYGVIQYAKNDKTKKAIQDVSDCYAYYNKITKDQWKLVYAAAADAAAYDAAAYDAAAAADAADAAADAAAYDAAAAYAAAADADAAAYDAARKKHRTEQANKLLKLLKECK